MKKTIGAVAGFVLSVIAAESRAQQNWDAKNNPTVDSIAAKYKGKMTENRPVSKNSDIFPVLGKYESATNPEAALLIISLDEQNKGIVWIDGLPQGKIKATLRKSPATYKIPIQKTETGKDVAEGTLIFDKETGTLRITIGKPYHAENPETAFAPEQSAGLTTTPKKNKLETKAAPKPWFYTGTRLADETAAQ